MEHKPPSLEKDEKLLKNIKANLVDLEKLRDELFDMWGFEDLVYRYYHQSFKAYAIQQRTLDIVGHLKWLDPKDVPALNTDFMQIVNEGTGIKFDMEHNKRWAQVCRPMFEAFFHAKYMLDMVIKYGKELDNATNSLPSGWAAVLYLYNIR